MPDTLQVPAELAELIALHREMFGGWSMMADEVDTPPATGEGAPTDEAAAGDEPLGEPGKKALVAEREARKQAQANLAALQKQIDDANKTAEQKAAEELAEAKKAVAASDAKALRYEIAAEKGVDLKLASRLVGTTREDLEADADKLLGLLGAIKPAKGKDADKPDPTQGQGTPPRPASLADALTSHYGG